MELRLNELAAHLERTLAPIYVIHGDEPLQAIEACDAIRAAARRAGFDEREVLVAEAGFKWDAFRRRQREPRALRHAQAHRPAHPVGQAGRRRREGARSVRRATSAPIRSCSSRCRRSTARRRARRGSRRSSDAGVAHRRLSAGARRAARVDRRAPCPPAAARRAGDARVSRRPVRGQPASPRTRKSKSSGCCCPKASSTQMPSSAR